MLQKKTLDIVAPIYNEEECIGELFTRLDQLREKMKDEYDVRMIFVNDGSKDKSWPLMSALADKHSYLTCIDLSRNFGHQIAFTAGVNASTADYIATIDADLQDPPELIPEMLEKTKEGFDVIYAKRLQREGETWFKLVTAKAFYMLLSKLCEVEIPGDTGDFRVMSRPAVEAFNQMPERHRFIRGMIPWCGFNTCAFEYHRHARFSGETKYPLRKMIHFALDGIFSFSNVPLRLMKYVGTIITLFGFLGAIYLLYAKLVQNTILPGFTALNLLIIILGGVQILSLGIIGDYLGRIFEESKRRPLYFIKEARNLKE